MFNYEDYKMYCALNKISQSKATSLTSFANFVGHKSKLQLAGVL